LNNEVIPGLHNQEKKALFVFPAVLVSEWQKVASALQTLYVLIDEFKHEE
jgi:hypothetical protein